MQKRLTVGLAVVFACIIARFSILAVILPPTKTVTLKWDYPYDMSGIVFNVYGTTNLGVPIEKWNLLTNVKELSCNIPMRTGMHFFTVAASNTVTKLQSELGN